MYALQRGFGTFALFFLIGDPERQPRDHRPFVRLWGLLWRWSCRVSAFALVHGGSMHKHDSVVYLPYHKICTYSATFGSPKLLYRYRSGISSASFDVLIAVSFTDTAPISDQRDVDISPQPFARVAQKQWNDQHAPVSNFPLRTCPYPMLTAVTPKQCLCGPLISLPHCRNSTRGYLFSQAQPIRSSFMLGGK